MNVGLVFSVIGHNFGAMTFYMFLLIDKIGECNGIEKSRIMLLTCEKRICPKQNRSG